MNVSRSSKTPLLAVLAVFAIANAVDFTFYGQHIYNLAALIGLSAVAHGVIRDKKITVNIGAAVAIAGIAAKYIQNL